LGNIKPTLHNLVLITVMAALGFLLARVAANTQLGELPVIGQGLKFLGAR